MTVKRRPPGEPPEPEPDPKKFWYLLAFYAVMGCVLIAVTVLAFAGQVAAAGITGTVWASACGVLKVWKP